MQLQLEKKCVSYRKTEPSFGITYTQCNDQEEESSQCSTYNNTHRSSRSISSVILIVCTILAILLHVGKVVTGNLWQTLAVSVVIHGSAPWEDICVVGRPVILTILFWYNTHQQATHVKFNTGQQQTMNKHNGYARRKGPRFFTSCKNLILQFKI